MSKTQLTEKQAYEKADQLFSEFIDMDPADALSVLAMVTANVVGHCTIELRNPETKQEAIEDINDVFQILGENVGKLLVDQMDISLIEVSGENH